MERKFLVLGSLLALFAVIAGAFGSHGLKNQLDTELLQIYETAVKYQMYHALAIILTGIILKFYSGIWPVRAGWFFLAGIILFSGSLYILSLSGIRWFGAVTPFGGLSFLCGWVCLIWAVRGKDKTVSGKQDKLQNS